MQRSRDKSSFIVWTDSRGTMGTFISFINWTRTCTVEEDHEWWGEECISGERQDALPRIRGTPCESMWHRVTCCAILVPFLLPTFFCGCKTLQRSARARVRVVENVRVFGTDCPKYFHEILENVRVLRTQIFRISGSQWLSLPWTFAEKLGSLDHLDRGPESIWRVRQS